MIFTDQIRAGIDVASRLHVGQLRKDQWKTPAVSHPFGVAMLLAQYTDVSEETVIAGLLHDVLEDVDPAKYDAADMERDFGADVVEIVQQVSEDRRAEWKVKKTTYLNQLAEAREEALMVSAADMTHNLSSFIDGYRADHDLFAKRFTGTKEQMIWFYGERAGIIHSRLKHPLAERAMEAYVRFQEVLSLD